MIGAIQALWGRFLAILFPEEPFSWQSIFYLAIFSWGMSWMARLLGATSFTQFILTTGSWLFWAIGLGWFLEDRGVRPLGINIAPWATGAIACIYLFLGLWPGSSPAFALISWPLISVAIIAAPAFFTWELKFRLPPPAVRQSLILVTLLAVLFSSWFQFYFRLQDWFQVYPTLLADNFSNSGFVARVPTSRSLQVGGIPLLTAAEGRVRAELQDTPWPWVERWLLNLEGQMQKIRLETQSALPSSAEIPFWELRARPRTRDNGYTLELLAVWRGPSAEPEGYYLTKTCQIRPQVTPANRVRPEQPGPNGETQPSTPLAQVSCDLEIPRRVGRP